MDKKNIQTIAFQGFCVPLLPPISTPIDPYCTHGERVHHHCSGRGEVHHGAGPLHQHQGETKGDLLEMLLMCFIRLFMIIHLIGPHLFQQK